jgi:hypothetical protein
MIHICMMKMCVHQYSFSYLHDENVCASIFLCLVSTSVKFTFATAATSEHSVSLGLINSSAPGHLAPGSRRPARVAATFPRRPRPSPAPDYTTSRRAKGPLHKLRNDSASASTVSTASPTSSASARTRRRA